MFGADISDDCSIETEVTVARLFAAAANVRGQEMCTIEMRLYQKQSRESAKEGDGLCPPLLSVEWTRQGRDAFLLCLDRAVSRIHPPLDPLQFTETPPEFLCQGNRLAVRLQLRCTGCLGTTLQMPYHTVEGEAKEVAAVAATIDSTTNTNTTTAANVTACGADCGIEVRDGASAARQRSRIAAWLTSRFFNEASWHSARGATAVRATDKGAGRNNEFGDDKVNGFQCDESVIEVSKRSAGKRVLHVDACGVEVSGLIVGITLRYAYVAIPYLDEQHKTSHWVIISRVPIPSILEMRAVGLARSMEMRKRSRDDDCARSRETFLHEREVMGHDLFPLHVLAPEQRARVTLRAYKVYCKMQDAEAASCESALLSVALEDASIISFVAAPDNGDDACGSGYGTVSSPESLTSFSDLLEIVHESCRRFLRGYEKYGAGAAGGQGEKLFSLMTDTVSSRLFSCGGGKTRRSNLPPVVVSSPRDIPSLFEGTCVEFKAKIGKWCGDDTRDMSCEESLGFSHSDHFYHRQNTGSNAKSDRSGHQNRGLMNMERIRHTIAAMASTLGGVLLVGVSDDGKVLGHGPDALKELRLSGFCPAMSKGSVKSTVMRAVTEEGPRELPSNWWKTKREPQQEQKRGQGDDKEARQEGMVTVITVVRGQAPFYTTSRHSVPYTRGFASTVPLHVLVIVRRIARMLT
ncbi:hypothetical protein ERJ75_000320700 [Trypanosoma vivax]|uniref:Trypanosoma vivax n=1 Tax=Trypanosoma vivax (strain Y486) TaxID=1055687 RepID=G0UA94_TRYVY|nr:Trypanosoma vivax [Trypanosoma vivax]KAH8617927.1 hypothetical protein ERJ75_000320700 [Trypanosoma vivax]CCC52726.1 Trypanosoma vivax [Trypanosoma vivax Y486]